ncbi:MAG: AAA family ATPase [Clostridia bacterium]|nr:AAA family ATPase [Clostridia bacterium]
MQFTKIVITGGPCAGKTTGLSYVERELTKIGYKVIFLNETATEIILSGADNTAFTNNEDFETQIIKLQLEKEKFYEKMCKTLPNEKVILICDRGVMDCKAYTTDEEFSTILNKLSLEEIQLRDNYDAVFHLVTAAKGAEEFYTKANNAARRENLEEARLADDKTMQCWMGHPHFRAIDNSTNFENKMKRLVKEICVCLGEPKPLEIERKFLIEKPDVEILTSIPNCSRVDIIQTYLISDQNEEKRVRQRGLDGSYIYTLTTKTHISDIKRIETEERITQREYLTLLNDADTNVHQIRKTRYCIMHNNKYFEIDIYPFSLNTAICEIELASEDETFEMPEYVKVIKEVTDDKRFSNYAFSKQIPEEMLNSTLLTKASIRKLK